MKLKHIIAVTVGAAALCAPSCDLDEKFYSEVTPDTFFTSPESTYAVLCRPFTHWKWYIGADSRTGTGFWPLAAAAGPVEARRGSITETARHHGTGRCRLGSGSGADDIP